MAIDETSAVLKARAFVSKANPSTVPVPMDGYLAEAKAVVRVEDDLQEGMLGVSFSLSGKNYICVNGNDSPERQRFTICHEIGHIVLGLPSDHKAQWWSAKRPMADDSATYSPLNCCFPIACFSRWRKLRRCVLRLSMNWR